MYYRCKCGEITAWGSMPPYPCSKCDKCGSNLATSPGAHTDPLPHDFVAREVPTDKGPATLSRCRWCGLTRAQALQQSDAT